MLYLGRFCSINIVFAQTVTFLRKKTAGGHAPGLNQRIYLPEMPTFEILTVLNPKGVFSQKKNRRRPHTGTQPKVILPEMPTSMHIAVKYQPI